MKVPIAEFKFYNKENELQMVKLWKKDNEPIQNAELAKELWWDTEQTQLLSQPKRSFFI